MSEVVFKVLFGVIWWSLGQIFLWYIQISLCDNDFGGWVVVGVSEVVIKVSFGVIWWSLGQIFLWYIQISLSG